jgi:hypothetical protein
VTKCWVLRWRFGGNGDQKRRTIKGWLGEEYFGQENIEENEILVWGWVRWRNETRRNNTDSYCT